MKTSFIIIIISTILTLQWFAVEGFIVYTGRLQQQFVLSRSLISLSAESSDTSSVEEVVTAKPTKTVATTKIPKSSSKNRISVNDNNNESTQQQPRQQQFHSMQSNSEEFELSCRVHTTITLLRKHFSSLLELPSLSESSAKWIYDSTNVTVVGPRGELLAVGIDEVIGVNRALALSSTAARRAGSLLDLAVNGGGGDAAIASSSKVECELILDPNNNQQLKILVLWKTRLPNADFSGRSIVYLSPQTGLVTYLQIEQVKINGVEVLDSLGTALATLRTASRSASSSIFDGINSVARSRGSSSTGNPLFDGIMSGIQEVVDAVEALPSEKTDSNLSSPLYVLPEHLWKNKTVFVGDEDDDSNEASASLPTPIDEYNMGQRTPMAGSDQFVEYAIVIKSLQNFATYALGRLAEGSKSESNADTEMIRELFITEAVLVATDKDGDDITLLRGGGKVADFYRSLSVLRGASGGDWKVINVDSNLGQRKLIVEWETDAPFKVMGKDAFIFETPELLALPLRLPMNTDGDIDDIVARCIQYFDESNDKDIPLKVGRVESLQLIVAGASADSEWAKSFVKAALRSGVVGNTIPDPTITELFRALTTKQSVKTAPKRAKQAAKSMPPLNDASASSFYGIIRSLHNDLPGIIADVEMKGTPQTPAEEFLADSIELRGLLGEVLMRGSESYNRLFGVVISSLRAAVRTNRVRLAAKPKPTIEITPNGSIKMDLVVALWIDAPTFPGQSKSNNGGFGVPLKIEISSLYKIDEAGKIREHQILESRLNGMLTPGDVFSRWIKSVASSDETKREDAGVNFASSFLDALSWVRSQSRRS